MRVSFLQIDIVWENKGENLSLIYQQLAQLEGKTDLVVLPEMCTTGFSMNSAFLAESNDGETITLLIQWAQKFRFAIAGSYIATENAKFYNRAFFITPEGKTHLYDKRHLFRMGNEPQSFSTGQHRTIIPYQGWNICILICYDLRFPVWSRNVGNEYDLLIYCANWPESRRRVWDILLKARALENMVYVCGVNRIGTDGNQLTYNGGSCIISPKGEELCRATDNKNEVVTGSLSLNELHVFRKKFPAWKDADNFVIQ